MERVEPDGSFARRNRRMKHRGRSRALGFRIFQLSPKDLLGASGTS